MSTLDSDRKLRLIREFHFFEGIPERVLEPLEGYFIPKELERGETLWHEGEEAVMFSFIAEGRMKVVKHRCDGKEFILGLFEGGEPIGHIAVFDEMDYPATAEALDDTLVLQIHRSHFLGTLRDEPELMEAVLRNVMARNHELVQRLHDVTISSAEQRLALLFDKLMYTSGMRKRSEEGEMYVFVPTPLSRGELAQLINTRSETVVRMMSEWRDQGICETLDEGFSIYRPAEIRELAGSEETSSRVKVAP